MAAVAVTAVPAALVAVTVQEPVPALAADTHMVPLVPVPDPTAGEVHWTEAAVALEVYQLKSEPPPAETVL